MLEFILILILSIIVIAWLKFPDKQQTKSGYKEFCRKNISNKKIDVDEQIDNGIWEKTRQILNSTDIVHASKEELHRIIDELATLDDRNLSSEIKIFSIEQIRSALLNFKTQLNERSFDSKGTTSSRQVLNFNLTDEEIEKAEFIVNDSDKNKKNNIDDLALGLGLASISNDDSLKSNKTYINDDIARELRYAEDSGFDELEELKNEEIYKEKLADYEYYADEDENEY